MNRTKKIKGLFSLLRFELPFSAGVCVILGQLLVLGEFAPVHETVFGFFSVFFVSAAILVLNDYFDVETDRINAPNRPIPSNIVTAPEALLLSISFWFLGLTLSYLINFVSIFVTIILSLIGYLYNQKFKKSGFAGNLMVSFSVGMTFIYGGVTVGMPFDKVVWFFGLIAALINLGEEISSDAMDMRGDAIINSNSLAIKYGRLKALEIGNYIFNFVILLTSIPFIFKWLQTTYLVPIVLMDLNLAYFSYELLKSENKDGRKYIRYIYLGATFSLVLIIIIRLFES